MTRINTKSEQRTRRRNRIRAKVSGTASIPRLAVFKSLKYIYAQLIDDENGVTLVGTVITSFCFLILSKAIRILDSSSWN